MDGSRQDTTTSSTLAGTAYRGQGVCFWPFPGSFQLHGLVKKRTETHPKFGETVPGAGSARFSFAGKSRKNKPCNSSVEMNCVTQSLKNRELDENLKKISRILEPFVFEINLTKFLATVGEGEDLKIKIRQRKENRLFQKNMIGTIDSKSPLSVGKRSRSDSKVRTIPGSADFFITGGHMNPDFLCKSY